MDYSVFGAVPIWLGDHAIECHVLLQPGPASFILPSADGDDDWNESSNDVLEKLGLGNMNIGRFDEPIDVSYSLDDLKAKGIDLSEVIEIDFRDQCYKTFFAVTKVNDAWVDVTTNSTATTAALVDSDVFESFSYACEYCTKTFKKETKLARHLLKFHAGKKKSKLKRNVANENVPERTILKTFKENLLPTQCRVCRKKFASTETRDRHLITFHKLKSIAVTPTAPAGIICPVCQSACPTKAHLALHMLQNHSTSRNVKTEQDKSIGPTKEAKSPDNPSMSSLVTPFTCCLCDKIVYSRLHLEVHTRVHTQEKPLGKKDGFPCDASTCRSLNTFKTNDLLLAHVEAVHAFGCSVNGCAELFASPDSLEQHFTQVHEVISVTGVDDGETGEASFNRSGKPLGRPTVAFVESYFKKHKSSRGKVSCTYCRSGDTFKTSSELARHFLQNHPYKCPYNGCDKIWKFRSSIRKHLRKHHPGMPLIHHCDHCLEIFTTRPELERHALVSHKQSLRKTNAKGPENAEFGNKPIEGVPELSDAEKFFRCPKCDKSYQHPDSIRKHCRKAHKIFVINCRHCFIVFLTAEEKAEHFALVHKNSAASPASSPSKESAEFSPIKPIPSPSNTSPALKSSIAADITSLPASHYKCPKCDRAYSIAKSLRKHCRLFHNLVSLTFCKLCDQVFPSLGEKDDHVMNDHSSESMLTDPVTLPYSPSSPEEFYGFTTPTKELEELSTVKRKLSLSSL